MASMMSAIHRDSSATATDVADEYANRPIDLVHLSHYTLGDSALEREILQLFRVQSRIYLDRLRDACNIGDWSEAAHTIKGSARGIGAWHLAECAANAEACKVGKNDKILKELESSVKEVNAFIKGVLADN